MQFQTISISTLWKVTGNFEQEGEKESIKLQCTCNFYRGWSGSKQEPSVVRYESLNLISHIYTKEHVGWIQNKLNKNVAHNWRKWCLSLRAKSKFTMTNLGHFSKVSCWKVIWIRDWEGEGLLLWRLNVPSYVTELTVYLLMKNRRLVKSLLRLARLKIRAVFLETI